MFLHLLKPIWKRKFKNLLLSLEIALAFVVIFAVLLVSVRFYQLSHKTIGFNFENVWNITIYTTEAGNPNRKEIFDNMQRTLSAMPEVESVSFASYAPYTTTLWTKEFKLPESDFRYTANYTEMSDEAQKTLQLHLLEGRWFSAIDDASNDTAVVVNKAMAERLFPGKSAVQQFIRDTTPDGKNRPMLKIVGVIDEYRNKGEYMTPTFFVIQRYSPLAHPEQMHRAVLLKLKPGTPKIFEARLSEQLKLIRNDWTYQIAPLAELRKSRHMEDMIPLMILAVLSCFLLVMVAFGLFGVLWQNTTQRIPEIGLRRAIGATAKNIYQQIITEQLLLCSLSMLFVMVFLIQIPITGVFGEFVNWSIFSIAVVLAMALIYLLSIICSLYPAWQASRLSPTEALHYE